MRPMIPKIRARKPKIIGPMMAMPRLLINPPTEVLEREILRSGERPETRTSYSVSFLDSNVPSNNFRSDPLDMDVLLLTVTAGKSSSVLVFLTSILTPAGAVVSLPCSQTEIAPSSSEVRVLELGVSKEVRGSKDPIVPLIPTPQIMPPIISRMRAVMRNPQPFFLVAIMLLGGCLLFRGLGQECPGQLIEYDSFYKIRCVWQDFLTVFVGGQGVFQAWGGV